MTGKFNYSFPLMMYRFCLRGNFCRAGFTVNTNLLSVSSMLILVFLMPYHVLGQQALQVEKYGFSFGKSGYIQYEKRSKTYSISSGKNIIMQGIAAGFMLEGKLISTSSYPQVSVTVNQIHDALGAGKSYAFTYRAKGLPALKQVFDVYPQHGYFLTQLTISGQKFLSTNFLSPLSGGEMQVAKADDMRSLFVPFDNDNFESYASRKLTHTINSSSEVGGIYNTKKGDGLIIGSLEQNLWKSGIEYAKKSSSLCMINAFSGFSNEKITRDQMPHAAVEGSVISSSRFMVGYFPDWKSGMDDFAAAHSRLTSPYIKLWTGQTPVGWNSWGSMQSKISFDKVFEINKYFSDSLSSFRKDNTAYIDLDSYWDKLITGGLGGDYSQLQAFAADCRSQGLTPGIYWAPFVDWGWKSGGKRKVEGSSFAYQEAWTKANGRHHDFDGARALDPTHPATRARIALVISKFRKCGFKFIKIDFLGHAAIESDRFFDEKIKTGMQAYQSGMKFLNDQLGGEMFVYAAISPAMASVPYVHSRRIACDAFFSIDDTKYTLNALSYGWWLGRMYPYLDADHIVFARESQNVNQARLVSGLITGTFILGDDFSSIGPWSNRAQNFFKNPALLQMINDGKPFRPLHIVEDQQVAEAFVKRTKVYTYLAVFNYTQRAKTIELVLPDLGLGQKESYEVYDKLNEKSFEISNRISCMFTGPGVFLYQIKNN